MATVIVCPECNGRLKLANPGQYEGRKIRCPKCSGIISVRMTDDSHSATRPARTAPAVAPSSRVDIDDARDEMPSGDDSVADDNDGWDSTEDDGWDDDSTVAGTEAGWGDLSSEIAGCDTVDAAALAAEQAGSKPKSQMHYRQSIMDNERYHDKNMGDYIPGLKHLRSLSGLFANAWVGFLVIVLAVCLVLGVPLVMLYKKWEKDTGAADGDLAKMLQTAGNLKTVGEAGKDVYEGNGLDAVGQAQDRIRQNNQLMAARDQPAGPGAAGANGAGPQNANSPKIDETLAELKPYPYQDDELARQRMKAVVAAFDAYQKDVTRMLPHATLNAGGQPSQFSWRVAILPYLDDPKAKQLAARFIRNVPWDDPHNLALLNEMPGVFRIPGSTDTRTVMHLFSGDMAALGGPAPIGLQQVTDGAGMTIGVFAGGPETAVPWTKPGGIEFVEDDPFSNLGTISQDGLPAVMLDGSAVLISPRIAASSFRNFVSHNDGTAFPEFTAGNDGSLLMGQTVEGTYYPGW